MKGLRYSPLHVTELCGEMQGKFKVGRARLKNIYFFQVVVVARFHSITPSLPVRHWKPGGSSHMKRHGLIVGKFEFNSKGGLM